MVAVLYYIAIIIGIIVAFLGIFMLGTYTMCLINEFTDNEKYSKFKVLMLAIPIVMYYAYDGLVIVTSRLVLV